MGLFSNNNQGQFVQSSPVTIYKNRYNRARTEIMFVIGLTVLNIALLFLSENGFYFLVSAYVPYFAIALVFMTELSAFTFLKVAAAVFAAVILGVYVLLFFLGKKRPGALIATLVLFSIDTAALIADTLLFYTGSILDSVFDLVFHALVLVYLVMGVIAASKLKKLGESVYSDPAVKFIPVANGQPANAPGADENGGEPQQTDGADSGEQTGGFAPGFIFKTEPKYDWDGKGKVRLSAEYNGINVCAVRKFGSTELVVNGKVYDTFDHVAEIPYNIGAEVNGVKFIYTYDAFANSSLIADGVTLASGRFPV